MLGSPMESVPFTTVWPPTNDDDPPVDTVSVRDASTVKPPVPLTAIERALASALVTSGSPLPPAPLITTSSPEPGKVPPQPLQFATVCQSLSTPPPVQVQIGADE